MKISRLNLFMGIFWIAVAVILGGGELAFGHPWSAVGCIVPLTVGGGSILLYLDQVHMARDLGGRL